MDNLLEDRRTALMIGAVTLFVILAAAIALGGYTLGQQNPQRETVAALPPKATEPPPRIETNTPTATSTPQPTPTLTATPTPSPSPTPIVVINHIKSLGRLETTEFAMQTVIDLANAPTNLWEQFFGTDKLMLLAEGEVVAGFDLTQIESGDITVEGQSVRIVLPAPEILYSRIDNERTRVYQRETGLFVSPDPTLEGRARQLAEESLVEWALERDIFDKAETAGQLQLENLLRSLGFTAIEITVKEKEL